MKPISLVPATLLTDSSSGDFLGGRSKNLEETCKEFESIFIKQMIKGMRRTVIKSGLLKEGMQKEIYQDLFDQQVAREMARGRGIGLGEKLYESLSRNESKEGGK